MKRFFLLLSFVLLGSTAFAEQGTEPVCSLSFATSQVCAQVEFLKGPVKSPEESQFQITFLKKDEATQTYTAFDPAFKVDLWMQMGHHGHGSSPVKVAQQSAGVYLVTEAYFVMSGAWQVRVTIDNEQKILDVQVP